MTEKFFSDGRVTHCTTSSISFEDGYFIYDEENGRCSSSGRKKIYKGSFSYSEKFGGYTIPAIAVFFISDDISDYVRELQGMVDAEHIGTGPRLIKSNVYRALPDSKTNLPLIIEEDAGISLDEVLDGTPIPMWRGGQDCPCISINELSNNERSVLSRKICFDVLSQISNIHSAGKWHRDIRCANIAVRAYGPKPIDVRATLIDLEFLTSKPTGHVIEHSYYDPLFTYGNWKEKPTVCEQEAGYITITLAEILSMESFSKEYSPGVSVDAIAVKVGGKFADTLTKLLSAPASFFKNEPGTARRITHEDAIPYAESLKLPTIKNQFTNMGRVISLANTITKHSAYLDTHDFEIIGRNPKMKFELQIEDKLAHEIFKNYNERRLKDGKEIEYERFEDQPADLQSSNSDQAANYVSYIQSIGYEVVLASDCPDERRVKELSEYQIEYIAEKEHKRWCSERIAKGWKLGERDAKAKTSPYLVALNELDEEIKGYDRDPVREMISMIESAGLAVRR